MLDPPDELGGEPVGLTDLETVDAIQPCRSVSNSVPVGRMIEGS